MNWPYRNSVLALAAYGFFSVQAARFAISPLVPGIIDTFSISKGIIGLALTAMWAAYALMQYPGGVLGDRYDNRPVLLGALTLTGIGSLGLAFVPSFTSLIALVVVLGFGAGLYFPVVASLVTDLFENDGQALGFIIAGSSLAGMIAPAVAASLSVAYGWRTAIPIGGVLVLPAIGMVTWRLRPTQHSDRTTPHKGEFRLGVVVDVLTRPGVAFTLGIAIVGGYTFQAVLSFIPTFLIEARSFSVQSAGIAFGGLFLLSAVSNAGMGRISDLCSRDTAISISMCTLSSGLAVLLLVPGVHATLVGVCLVGLGLSWGGVINARFVDNLGENQVGTGLGLCRTVFILVASLGSVITGVLADVSGWTAAYGLVIFLLVTVVLVIGVSRRRGSALVD